MGRMNPLSTGRCIPPTCKAWNVDKTRETMNSIHSIFGLEYGVMYGKSSPEEDWEDISNGRRIKWVNVDTCPREKVK